MAKPKRAKIAQAKLENSSIKDNSKPSAEATTVEDNHVSKSNAPSPAEETTPETAIATAKTGDAASLSE